jgi:FtsZ-binding cell division protein ZapB
MLIDIIDSFIEVVQKQTETIDLMQTEILALQDSLKNTEAANKKLQHENAELSEKVERAVRNLPI